QVWRLTARGRRSRKASRRCSAGCTSTPVAAERFVVDGTVIRSISAFGGQSTSKILAGLPSQRASRREGDGQGVVSDVLLRQNLVCRLLLEKKHVDPIGESDIGGDKSKPGVLRRPTARIKRSS